MSKSLYIYIKEYLGATFIEHKLNLESKVLWIVFLGEPLRVLVELNFIEFSITKGIQSTISSQSKKKKKKQTLNYPKNP